MELTPEQQAIINAAGDIKINAVAGSGKTTTIIEYAKTRPANSRILYLAFNKSVKLEAAKRFADEGLHNVKVETAHSLAYKHIVHYNNYKIKPQGYKTAEIAEMLHLEASGEKHAEYIIANHINKFIAYFCNSDKKKVQELNYLNTIYDEKAKAFVKTFYSYIENKTRLLLSKMDKGAIEITHDFYLKKFQLSNPVLYYDYILFDEGQDASPAMLDVFLNQKATKVIVGDTHQQIYGWRYAVNSLEKANFATYHLSTSFRFSQDVADLAMEVLQWKRHIEQEKQIAITGKGSSKQQKTKAVLARTNLGLLLKAIEYVTTKKYIKHIYFEGNIHSYTYADEGASLYDVLNLYNKKHDLIRDKLIKGMKDMKELEEYIEKTEDTQLQMMVEIVKEYENDIPNILKKIKDKHIDSDDKAQAEMIFSTVHRCKGMEYDYVQLVDDFITEKRLEKLKEDKENCNTDKLNEEVNLLYVAITRTKNVLHIPDTLIRADFPSSPNIQIIPVVKEEEKKKAAITPIYNRKEIKEKSNTYKRVRTVHKVAYKPWTDELDHELMTMYYDGITIGIMAKHFGKTYSVIKARLNELALE
ncbi:ATP-dependent helicase [Ilyomonas limi]|uniref:ATP-dependent helicase n=1 Tax=Ilyomonas limi TaxID=2575867 RepID=A0A4U3KWX2_9BACT|nr:UvrD-helicase domain-containing protein [Ilyomonas limi]TKK65567.1 ATP-dependent helicase [Ilyomonas limi]